ncbi:docking protein 4 [Micropterus dolomieu]|uniref:docking protein 4 n=1 Tax=Micropterus dolomieu TaxID=147949 RepID=UPI001E8E7E8E|nr:docking protein 4 [Micropterus dolomieu]
MASNFNDIVKQGYVRMRSRKLGSFSGDSIIVSDEDCNPGPSTDRDRTRTGLGSRRSRGGRAAGLEAEDWFKTLSIECLGTRLNDISMGEPDLLAAGVQCEHTERFNVFLLPCPNLDIYGECMMQITHENIYLWDIHNPRTKLVTWPLCSLRRYGRDATRFTFEAGRMCDSGEGLYTFQTREGEQIYQRVHSSTLAIAEQHKKVLLEMEKTSRLRVEGMGSEPGSYPCTPTAILPRSAYWHHITGNQTGMDPGSGDAAEDDLLSTRLPADRHATLPLANTHAQSQPHIHSYSPTHYPTYPGQ